MNYNKEQLAVILKQPWSTCEGALAADCLKWREIAEKCYTEMMHLVDGHAVSNLTHAAKAAYEKARGEQ